MGIYLYLTKGFIVTISLNMLMNSYQSYNFLNMFTVFFFLKGVREFLIAYNLEFLTLNNLIVLKLWYCPN